MSRSDTIVALSSGSLPSGVAVLRLSGARVGDLFKHMTGGVPRPRVASYRSIGGADGVVIDHGIVLFFPGPGSFTGEDCGELQVHGSRAVVAALLQEICRFDGCRIAEPGEFMRRAFLNGKVDLLQAEAIADLISAETEAQRRLAIANGRREQRLHYEELRRRIIYCRAMAEVSLDFAEEGDVGEDVADVFGQELRRLVAEVGTLVGSFRKAEIVREGLDVVIVGEPNAGKSSLINALACREVAIVSDEPGTTRDLIEVALDVNGFKVRLTDSAGIRDTSSKAERIGVDRAWERAAEADVVLYLSQTSVFTTIERKWDCPTWTVATKSDLGEVGQADFVVSALGGSGIDVLISRIGKLAEELGAGSDILPWRSRHIELLKQVLVHLVAALENDIGLELQAEELRIASDLIGRMSGSVDVEDLLDVIFSQFCIGK